MLSTQYIMEGFFEMSAPAWVIRVATRAVAIVPAFYVVYSRGPDAAAELIEQAQVVVNFVVPFTVIPLTRFLSSPAKMGPFRLSKGTEHACWAASAVAVGLNLLAIQQAIDEGVEGGDDGLKLACTLVVTGAYLYFSWWFFNRPIMVATPGLGGGEGKETGGGGERESFVANGSKGEASSGDDVDIDGHHNVNGEELSGAWLSSPGVARSPPFFMHSPSPFPLRRNLNE